MADPIRKALGNYRDAEHLWVYLPAKLPLSWEPTTTITRFRMHRLVAAQTQAWLDELHKEGLWHLLKDFGGSYNVRRERGGLTMSSHSWPYAVDFNTRRFPLGSKNHQDSRLVVAAERWGFINGARWNRPDPMHFQVDRFVVPVYDSNGWPHPGELRGDGKTWLPIREVASALGKRTTWDAYRRMATLV